MNFNLVRPIMGNVTGVVICAGTFQNVFGYYTYLSAHEPRRTKTCFRVLRHCLLEPSPLDESAYLKLIFFMRGSKRG